MAFDISRSFFSAVLFIADNLTNDIHTILPLSLMSETVHSYFSKCICNTMEITLKILNQSIQIHICRGGCCNSKCSDQIWNREKYYFSIIDFWRIRSKPYLQKIVVRVFFICSFFLWHLSSKGYLLQHGKCPTMWIFHSIVSVLPNEQFFPIFKCKRVHVPSIPTFTKTICKCTGAERIVIPT